MIQQCRRILNELEPESGDPRRIPFQTDEAGEAQTNTGKLFQPVKGQNQPLKTQVANVCSRLCRWAANEAPLANMEKNR